MSSMKDMVREWVGATVMVPVPFSGGAMQMVCTVKDCKMPYGNVRLLVGGRSSDVRGEAWILASTAERIEEVKA